MLKTLLRSAAAASLVAATTTALPAPADAATAKCRVVSSATVGGFAWSRMPTARVCSNSLGYGVSGLAQLSQHRIIIHYSERNTTTRQVAKGTVHEMAHNVEWRTTAAHRARLYRFVGLRNPSGNYFAINDARYNTGRLADWKRSPRERLAESVVNCTYGTPNHYGMALVPRSQCRAFLGEFRSALAAAH